MSTIATIAGPSPHPSAYELGRMLSSHETTTNFRTLREQTTEIIVVPSSEHVAQIVGKNGYKIKRLREATNTCIRTPLRGDFPIFKVTGSPANVRIASDALNQASDHFSELIRSRSNACAVGEVTILVEVPHEYVGVVVGRNGSHIMKIKDQTRTRINTPKSDSIRSAFEVTGTKLNVEAAKEAILDRVRDALNIKDSVKFDPALQHKSLALNQSNVWPPIQHSLQTLAPPPGLPPIPTNLLNYFSRPATPMLALPMSPSGLSPNYFEYPTVDNNYNQLFNIFDN